MKQISSLLTAVALLCGVGMANGQESEEVQRFKATKIEAEQGDAESQYELGGMYLLAQGVPKDDVEAAKWYRRAAKQGHAEAQCLLGMMYLKGDGVPKNYEESAKWYRKAAEQGFARGQLNLSKAYLQADGVPKNYIESYAWALLAKANADVTSSRFGAFEDHISALEKILTAEHKEKGQARMAELHRLIEQKRKSAE